MMTYRERIAKMGYTTISRRIIQQIITISSQKVKPLSLQHLRCWTAGWPGSLGPRMENNTKPLGNGTKLKIYLTKNGSWTQDAINWSTSSLPCFIARGYLITQKKLKTPRASNILCLPTSKPKVHPFFGRVGFRKELCFSQKHVGHIPMHRVLVWKIGKHYSCNYWL